MSRDTRGKVPGRKGFLARLRRDERGNTLAIMAAALIPMIGMVGSAVDISRAYLVKTRLQQACDAGVLAARRSMTGLLVASDTNAKQQATNFFNINLKNGAYGATVTSITVTDASGKPGTIDEKKLRSYEENWGKLPEAERKKIVQDVVRDLPPKFKPMIEDYFRSLNRMHGYKNA